MNSKFGGLAAKVEQTHRVNLLDPITDDVLKNRAGAVAYIDVLSMESEAGRKFDAEARARAVRAARKSPTGMADDIDQREENHQKLARLTVGWHLVDPTTGETLDVPCTHENAIDLYSEPGMHWLFIQVFMGASNAGNFMTKSPSPPSSPSPKESFAPSAA